MDKVREVRTQDWNAFKRLLENALMRWRIRREAGDVLAPYYVDAYACKLHNMEHIERGELPADVTSDEEAKRDANENRMG